VGGSVAVRRGVVHGPGHDRDVMTDPMEVFRAWHQDAVRSGAARQPNAVCLATVDDDGMPHARFVDLKEVRPDGFVFCTSYVSPKARHIDARPHVSLTFWWDHVGRQVRVLGTAGRIAAAEADAFFAERSRAAQLTSWAYDQSQPLQPGDTLSTRAAAVRDRFGNGPVPRPPTWGGYLVAPRRVEFLAFRADRAHERTLYVLDAAGWIRSELQP
jgi:pyridoxamine 5'-phosphate oxidase